MQLFFETSNIISFKSLFVVLLFIRLCKNKLILLQTAVSLMFWLLLFNQSFVSRFFFVESYFLSHCGLPADNHIVVRSMTKNRSTQYCIRLKIIFCL